MKTLNTPLPVHENTVIESEYDEVQTKAKRKRKPHRTRADHKHKYEPAYYESHFKSPVSGNVITTYHQVKYCTVCGRINSARFTSTDYNDIPAGSRVFRSSLDDGNGYMSKFVPDLTDFFIKE